MLVQTKTASFHRIPCGLHRTMGCVDFGFFMWLFTNPFKLRRGLRQRPTFASSLSLFRTPHSSPSKAKARSKKVTLPPTHSFPPFSLHTVRLHLDAWWRARTLENKLSLFSSEAPQAWHASSCDSRGGLDTCQHSSFSILLHWPFHYYVSTFVSTLWFPLCSLLSTFTYFGSLFPAFFRSRVTPVWTFFGRISLWVIKSRSARWESMDGVNSARARLLHSQRLVVFNTDCLCKRFCLSTFTYI